MYNSEIKLIHFDNAFYIPASIPLMHVDNSDNDSLYNNVGFVHIRRVYLTETNGEELVGTIKCVPVACSVCGTDIFLSDMKEVVDHVFSQSHIDQFMKVHGSMSKRDFTFWTRLLKIFPKDSESPSHEKQQEHLLHMSTKLDLHARLKHFTVEVSTASDQITSIIHFISASLSRSERVIVYCTNRSHCDWISSLIDKHCSQTGTEKRRSSYKEESQSKSAVNKSQVNFSAANTAKGAYAKTKQGLLWKISIDPLGKASPNECVVYLHPPSSATDSLDALCAFDLCASHVQCSLMLLHGEEQKADFRAFEKKFLHPNDCEIDLLPIYDITVLILLDETAKVEENTKNTVDQSITPTATVPSEVVSSSHTVADTLDWDAVDVDAYLAKLRRLPREIMLLLDRMEKSEEKIPSASFDVFLADIEVQMDSQQNKIEVFKKQLEEKKEEDQKWKWMVDINKALKKSEEMRERIRCMRLKAQQKTTVTMKITVPEKLTSTKQSTVSKKSSGSKKSKASEKPTVYIPRKEFKQTAGNSNPESTVSMQNTVENPSIVPSTLQKAVPSKITVHNKISTKKNPPMRTMVWTVTSYCVEGKIEETRPEEKRKEKKSRRDQRKKKKWPEIFIPFDEEMGKKVDEIIRMMTETQSLAD